MRWMEGRKITSIMGCRYLEGRRDCSHHDVLTDQNLISELAEIVLSLTEKG